MGGEMPQRHTANQPKASHVVPLPGLCQRLVPHLDLPEAELVTYRPLGSSFLWFIFRILQGNPQKELLGGLWVVYASGVGLRRFIIRVVGA